MNNNNSHSDGTHSIKPARLIRADGTEQLIAPQDGKYFTCAELYPVINCTMVEVIGLPNGNLMLLDENGKLTRKPRNDVATAIATNIMPGDYIAGDVVVCDDTQLERGGGEADDEESTLIGAAEAIVAASIDPGAVRKAEPIYWMGDVKTCDLCGTDLRACDLFVDGIANDAWFVMCALCFLNDGVGLGWGHGQLYSREPDRKWRAVAGLPGQPLIPTDVLTTRFLSSRFELTRSCSTEPTTTQEVSSTSAETLAHFTLTTGHMRMSPRHEVGEKIIRLLDPLVANGGGWLPAGDQQTAIGFTVVPAKEFAESGAQDWVGIEISVRESGSSKPNSPIIVGALAWSEDAAENAYESMRCMAAREGFPVVPEMPPGVPLLIVMLTAEAVVVQPKLLVEVADLERCLAWTILAQEGLAS